jgi:hypothetical protein
VRKLGFLLVLGSLSLLAACGGGGGGGGNTGTITGVSVSCSPSTVSSGQTSQCAATVTGTGNFSTAVSWTTTAGSISTAGLLSAPIVTSSTTVTVTATSTQNTSISGTFAVTVNPTAAGPNVAPITVDGGPDTMNAPTANIAYVTVTVCVPGSTTQCQVIDHVQVDTGSSGLRVLSGVLTVPLPGEDNLAECTVFADGFVWGPIATADITVSGESASAVPVQIMIPSTSSPAVPPSCSSQNPSGGNGNEGGSVDAFGANAIIGVGLFQQDCGQYCVTNSNDCDSTQTAPCIYYTCTTTGCTPTTASLTQQVPNPVTMFATDNNGVLIQLENVPDGGSAIANGSLIFGIGTESNNALGGATVYPVPDSGNNAGDFITTFGGQTYPQSFVDSGSNAYFFLDSGTTGISTCAGSLSAWYCPTTSPDNLTAMNQGQAVNNNNNNVPVGSNVPVSFSIENASNLFNTGNFAYSTLGGTNPGAFDWGLSFFYGRNVFTAIDTVPTPGGTGPYFAY